MFEDFRLKVFTELAAQGSFTATARKLGISQPAVSQNIAEIENNYGIRLFDRSRKSVELTREGGKTLFLSDLNPEDIETFNSSHHFSQTIDSHFTTGANGISVHYLVNNSELLSEFAGHQILDDLASSVIPSISLTELPDAKVLARSVSIADGELKTGVDLQIIPFGKGRIVFNQLNLFEGLETNPLADRVFTKLVQMLVR